VVRAGKIELGRASAEMSRQRAGGRELSEPEQRFNRRWRELIDRAGGQSRVVNRVGWSSSTVSRDYLGQKLPTEKRLRQLCTFLGLKPAEQEELLELLEEARAASQAYRRGDGLGTLVDKAPAGNDAMAAPQMAAQDESLPGQVTRIRTRSLGRWQLVTLACTAAAVAVLGVLFIILVVVRHPGRGTGTVSQEPGVPVAKGSYPGLDIKAIPIRDRSLAPGIGAAFLHGSANRAAGVDGYVFRNMKNPSLCLTADDTGPDAGQNRDRVDIETCDYAPNQVWIPQQWEATRGRFTQLVSFRYQSKCLNAQYIGGLANGHKTMLWNCYKSPNEYWDFGDWYQSVKDRGRAYPIFVQSAPFCLDADKFDFGTGGDDAPVNIWDQYPTANQFWS
jgi:hypothetical protein